VEKLLPLIGKHRIKQDIDSDFLEHLIIREILAKILKQLTVCVTLKHASWVEVEFEDDTDVATSNLGMGSKGLVWQP